MAKLTFLCLAERILKDLVGITKDLDTAITAADDTGPELYDYSEADLHPFLAYYARIYFTAYTKTIRHNTSKKKEFGEWVHPDVIEVYYAVEDWKPSVLDLSAATGNTAEKYSAAGRAFRLFRSGSNCDRRIV